MSIRAIYTSFVNIFVTMKVFIREPSTWVVRWEKKRRCEKKMGWRG